MKASSILAWLVTLSLFSGTYWMLTEKEFSTVQELENTYARKKTLLSKLSALPEKERLIKNQLVDLGGEAASAFLYEGEDHEVQSYVQRDVRRIAGEAGVNISSMRPLGKGTATDSLLSTSSVQLNFTAPYEQLIIFLSKLESVQPLLRAKRVSVRVQLQSTPSRAAVLAVTVDVNAFRRAEK